MPEKIPVIFGPTASGKSQLAIDLAKRHGGEIISADSRQIYKGMDIGTGKLLPGERQGIIHHLIDIINPDRIFSAAEFVFESGHIIKGILKRGRLPVIAGGTGFYIKALIDGFTEIPHGNSEIRANLRKEIKTEGKEKQYEYLCSIDPKSGVDIHPNNIQRIIRAIEVFETTGIPFSDFKNIPRIKPLSEYKFILFFINVHREKLYNDINNRVDEMERNGLFKEAAGLAEKWGTNSPGLKTIGYREIADLYLSGKKTHEQTIDLIKRNTRKYAKRQVTWMRHAFENKGTAIDSSASQREKFALVKRCIS
ncbi:MAG: tRNA (adenosine(37)-N6)-dimethylallyltransferase MiaA [bacterium]